MQRIFLDKLRAVEEGRRGAHGPEFVSTITMNKFDGVEIAISLKVLFSSRFDTNISRETKQEIETNVISVSFRILFEFHRENKE